VNARPAPGADPQVTGAVAGIGTFVLAVLLLLLFVSPEAALLGGLAAGLVTGIAVFGFAALVRLAPVPPRPAAAPAAAGVDRTVGEAPAATPPSRDLSETARLSPEEVLKAADLHQTIRLDQGGLDIVLPEVSPESVLRDREGIDEAFLRAGLGIEEGGLASENVAGPGPGPEEPR